MYTIRAQTLTGYEGVLYDPNHFIDENRIVYDMTPVEKELGKAGSFSFTVPKVNPMYNTIYRFGTEISLYKQPGDLLWKGRISNITNDFYCNKNVRCEGALCYLNDIMVRPFVYKTGTGNTFRVSPMEHYGELGKLYGERCSNGRGFTWGSRVPDGDILFNTEPYSFAGVSEYITVREAIDDILALDDDLSIDVVYLGADCSLSLSRLPFYTVDVSRTGIGIDLKTNMINYSEEFESDEVYTAIIPLGEKNRVIKDHDFYNPGLVEKYGRIEKVVSFDSANSDQKLARAAELTLAILAREDTTRVTLTAVDLYHLGLNTDMIDIGCTVPLTSKPHALYHNERFVCTNASIDIENPENSSYTFKRM